MKLTKEDCEFALKCIISHTDTDYHERDEDVLNNLINEHFDNPPLKFEELQEGMWVWIYRESAYRKILCTQTLSGVQFVIIDMSDNTERCIIFSSTEFFAREVK